MRKKAAVSVLLVSLACCGAMTLVDGVWMPGYGVKSAVKIALFLIFPFLCSFLNPEVVYRSLFRPNKKGLLVAFPLGIALFGVILGGYFLLSPYFDFSNIVGSLTENAGITANNFLFVSLYISFVNSLLEEFFFRGFVFTNLKHSVNRGFAYLFSSLLFSLYHTAMMMGWFSFPLFLLVLAGLAVGGAIFNFLNEKYNTVFVSWVVHMFTNFAINTIGFMLWK